ncbi:uncharacterized protein LOC142239190 [Haematobia irritans]|uniref:uncharacterized protein LOC142239190 n=1 Tax=Haematobia irritans TaxID=7368 RepID=UPI003F4F4662
MPKLSRKSLTDDENEEPNRKILRRSDRIRNQNQNANPRASAPTLPLPPSKTITDLPPEILEMIIANVNIWHHNRIRAASKQLRTISDLHIRHGFNKALHEHIAKDPWSYESAVLKTIQLATEVYTRYGFESVFCGCLLPMLRSSYKNPYCPPINMVNKFFAHFYNMIDDIIGDTTLQQSRLLYILTLLKILRSFKSCSVVSRTSLPFHWRVVIELQGPWLGMLWNTKGVPNDRAGQRNNLLVILTEMLIFDMNGKAFKRVVEIPRELYVFGNDTSRDKRTPPNTLFTLTVQGSKKICNLFETCLQDSDENFVWPPKWPKYQFTTNLDIMCKEAMKWGCSKLQHYEFSPFSKTIQDNDNDDDGEDEEDDIDLEYIPFSRLS